MLNIMNKTSPAENFVIENNIIKGADRQFDPDNFQAGKLLFDTLSSKPDHVSQIEAETGKKTTLAEMKDRSVRCALWLKKQGIGRHDVVAIRTDDDANAYIPIFASFFLGATYNALNHLHSLDQTQELMNTIQPKVLFVSGNGTETVVQAAKNIESHNLKIIVFDNAGNSGGFRSLNNILEDQNDDEVKNFQPERIISSEDIAYIILSSGTTALPKPIMHSYGNLVKQIFLDTMLMYSIVLWYSPVYWSSGFVNLLHTIIHYRTRIIHANFDAEETSKVVEKYKVEQIAITSPAVDSLCQSNVLKKYQLKSLKLLLPGGTKLNRRMLEELHKCLPHASIRQLYGFSEAALYITAQTENSKTIHSVGFVFPGVEIKIRDFRTNEAMGPNTLGELCAKTCTLMKGYLKNEEATKAAVDAEGWYHTGDAAYYNEDGEIFVIDRIVDAIVYKNHQIWPSQIEDILLNRDDVLEAAVVQIPHEMDGARPIVFVKKAPDSNVTEKELMKSLQSFDENDKFYGVVKFIDKLPRLAGGKIIRKKLIEMARALV